MDSTTAAPRLARDERMRNLKILLLEPLTPLLRNEIHHAITLYSEATEHPDIDYTFEDIDILYDRIAKHWTRIYATPISRATMIQNIALFQQFLTAKLLEVYANEPHTINQWVYKQAAIIERHRAGAKDSSDEDPIYQTYVVFPLEELMLSQDHVENKLLSAVAEQRSLRNQIQCLIDENDWSGLAIALRNDRDLATTLFGEAAFDPELFDGNPRKKVLQGIDKIESEYFAKSGLSIYTDAREVLAKQVSNNTGYRASLTSPGLAPSNANFSEKPASGNSLASKMYNAISSGLRGTNSNPSPRNITKQI